MLTLHNKNKLHEGPTIIGIHRPPWISVQKAWPGAEFKERLSQPVVFEAPPNLDSILKSATESQRQEHGNTKCATLTDKDPTLHPMASATPSDVQHWFSALPLR